MFRQLMLDDRNQEKIRLYRRLLTLKPDIYNFSWLSHFFTLPYSRIVSLIKEINQQLLKIEPQRGDLLTDEQKIVLTAAMPSEESLTISLIRQDIPYLFLLEVIENHYETLEDFADFYHVSPSTVRRKLLPLKNYLAQYHITIKFSTLELLGSERTIRALLTALLWWSSRGRELPIDHFAIHEVNRQMRACLLLSPQNEQIATTKLLHKLDADITYHRVANGHYIEDFPVFGMNIMEKVLLKRGNWGSYIGAPTEYWQAETSYMAFRLFYGPVYCNPHDPALIVVREMMPSSSPQLNQFLLMLRQFIHIELFKKTAVPPSTEDEFALLLGNFITIVYNYLVFQSKIPFFLLLNVDKAMEKSRMFQALLDRCKGFFERIAQEFYQDWLDECLDDMCYIFAAMLLPDYEMSPHSLRLRVAILLDDQYVYNRWMKKFLNSLFYVDFQDFKTDKLNTCDVIITSNYQLLQPTPNTPIILFPLSNNTEDFFKLGATLEKYYLSKINECDQDVSEKQREI